jgi:hypothetical protein
MRALLQRYSEFFFSPESVLVVVVSAGLLLFTLNNQFKTKPVLATAVEEPRARSAVELIADNSPRAPIGSKDALDASIDEWIASASSRTAR